MVRGWRLLGFLGLMVLLAAPAASAASTGSGWVAGGHVGFTAHALGHQVDAKRNVDGPTVTNPLPGILHLPDLQKALDATINVPWLHAGAAVDAGAQTGPAGSSATTQGSSMVSAPQASTDPAAVAGILLTLGGLVVAFWGSISAALGRGLATVVPLFSRIPREEVLQNDTRAEVYRVVKGEPGICASEVARRCDISWGTTTYHLHVLASNHYVTSLREGRHRRYFENGGRYRDSKEVISVLRNDTTRAVLRTIRDHPGLPQKAVAERVELSPQALHWHLRRLQGHELLTKVRDGRVVRYFPAMEDLDATPWPQAREALTGLS